MHLSKVSLLCLGVSAQIALVSMPAIGKEASIAPVSNLPKAGTPATAAASGTASAKAKPGAVPATVNGPGSPGYRVEATSNYAGTLSCQMCKDGIRVKSDRMGLTWILTAPKWNAQIYNTSTECYMDLPYNEWTKRQSFMPMAKKKTVLKLEKTDNTKMLHGLKARQFVIMATFTAPPPGSVPPGAPGSLPGSGVGKQKTGKTAAPQTFTVREAEMWVAKDPCVPRQFNELMSKIFGFPTEDGLPLSISLRQKTGKITSIWETVKLSRSNISKEEFAPIVGFKKVKTEVEMMLGDQDLGLSDDGGLDSKPLKRPKMDEMP